MIRYWQDRRLIPYEFFHGYDGSHYPPEPAVILGRCGVKQFIEASELLGTMVGVSFEINTRASMQEIDHDSRKYPEEHYLEYLFDCSKGTVFAFLDPFDEKPMHQHIQENLYGTVTFEGK